jgi:hypothetical protein
VAKKLEGPALKTAQSLASALAADNGPQIKIRFARLQGMLGKGLGAYKEQVLDLLDDNQTARLTRIIPSFEA